MKLNYLGLAMAGLVFVAPGCKKDEPPPPPAAPTNPPEPPKPAQLTGYNLSLSVDPEPAMVGMNKITLDLTDPNNAVVGGANLAAEVTGGPAPLNLTFAPGDVPGRYVAQAELPQAGNYVLKVKAIIPDKGEFNQDVALNNVQAPDAPAAPAGGAPAGKPAEPPAPEPAKAAPGAAPSTTETGANRGEGSGRVGAPAQAEPAAPSETEKGSNRGKGSGRAGAPKGQ